MVEAFRSASDDARLVHVSSLAAAGPSRDGQTAIMPPEACSTVSHYGESKRLGEMEVRRVDPDKSWIVLRPPVVYGPGDVATRLLFAHALAPLVFVPSRPRPISLMHVDDLARAILLAADVSASGLFVPLDGPDRLDTTTLPSAIAAACRVRRRLVPIPDWLARAVAWGSSGLGRLRGVAPFLSIDKMREVHALGWVSDAEPASRLIGFRAAIGAAEGLRRTAIHEGFANADSPAGVVSRAGGPATPSGRGLDSPPGRR
jgi:nucleoside-diphosphate-sugar epimerase